MAVRHDVGLVLDHVLVEVAPVGRGLLEVGLLDQVLAIFLFSVASFTKPWLLVVVDCIEFPVSSGWKKSAGCGKSWNQSAKPVWALVVLVPMRSK